MAIVKAATWALHRVSVVRSTTYPTSVFAPYISCQSTQQKQDLKGEASNQIIPWAPCALEETIFGYVWLA